MSPMAHLLPHSGSNGRVTASDRLEADKAKYVKSPQVIHRRQNPAINTTFTPVLSRKSGQLPSSPPLQTRQRQSPKQCDKSERVCQPCVISRPSSPSERFPPSSPSVLTIQANHKDQTNSPTSKWPLSQSLSTSVHGNNPQTTAGPPAAKPRCVRRLSGKRINRPDSLIIYRQKREVVVTSKENHNEEAGLVIRLLQGTPLLRRSSRFSQNPTQSCKPEVPISPRLLREKEKTLDFPTSSNTQERAHESPLEEPMTFTDFEAQKFFESCGLEGSLLNLLNSYQKAGDTPMGSLESMDRVSCARGVSEEEKEVKAPVSVIERNARVIKWIYSCHQARSIGGQGNGQLTRESTV